jgi:N-ethylmaleimide reductase
MSNTEKLIAVVGAAGQQGGAQLVTLVKQLSALGLAYLHVVDYSSFGFPPVPAELRSLLRQSFGGSFVRAGGFARSSAERELATERAA